MTDELSTLRRERDEARARGAQLEEIAASLRESLAVMQKAFEDQKAVLERLVEKQGQLERRLFGRTTEKMPSPAKVIAEADGTTPSREEITAKRRARSAERREQTPVRSRKIEVEAAKRICPCCGSTKLKTVGNGRTQRLLEYVPPRFVYEESILETLACSCNGYVVTAKAPQKPFEQSPHGPRFIAHAIVSKLLDAMPHYRLEKALARQGLRISRQTMTDSLHRAAGALEPLVARLFVEIAASEIVQADETPQRRQDTKKKAYLWTFLAEHEKRPIIAYRFSADRSGDTPRNVLRDSRGILLVDQYSGYELQDAASAGEPGWR